MDSVFTKIDSYNHNILGFNLIGAFRNIGMWRRYIFLLTIASILLWVSLGFESTWSQLSVYLQSIPALLLGQTSITAIQTQAALSYGIGQHLSTATIYGVCFLLLSIHLEKQHITKSMNFCFSAALSFMSIGIYEITYNFLYSNLQHQSWTFSLMWRQGLNISVFSIFILIGVVALGYLYTLHYKPHFGKLTFLFLVGSVLTYILWIFYPFSTATLTIGAWTSARLFPQTMYAVGPINGIAVGIPYYVSNNLLHLVNIINKAFVSLTVLSLVMIRSKTK